MALLPLRGKGTDLGFHVERRSDADRLSLALEDRQEAVFDAGFDDQAGAGNTALAGCRKNSGNLRIGGTFEIGVGKDDEGRFAAQFQ